MKICRILQFTIRSYDLRSHLPSTILRRIPILTTLVIGTSLYMFHACVYSTNERERLEIIYHNIPSAIPFTPSMYTFLGKFFWHHVGTYHLYKQCSRMKYLGLFLCSLAPFIIASLAWCLYIWIGWMYLALAMVKTPSYTIFMRFRVFFLHFLTIFNIFFEAGIKWPRTKLGRVR